MVNCHICGEEENPVRETEKHCVSCGNPAQDKNSRWYAWTKADMVQKIEALENEIKTLCIRIMVLEQELDQK